MIYANDGGEIGGWTINDARLYSNQNTSTSGYVGICSGNNNAMNANRAFYAGATTYYGNNAKFYVTNEGYLYAKDAYIEGTIHATDGEFTGTIHATGGQIDGNVTINGCLNLGHNYTGTNTSLTITQNGKLTCTGVDVTGTITATSGNIDALTAKKLLIKNVEGKKPLLIT